MSLNIECFHSKSSKRRQPFSLFYPQNVWSCYVCSSRIIVGNPLNVLSLYFIYKTKFSAIQRIGITDDEREQTIPFIDTPRMSQNIPQTYPKQGSGYSRGLYSYEKRSMRGFGSMVKNMIAQSYIHVFNKQSYNKPLFIITYCMI